METCFFLSFAQGMGHYLDSRAFSYVMSSLANNKMPTEFYEVSAMLANYTSNIVMINNSDSKGIFFRSIGNHAISMCSKHLVFCASSARARLSWSLAGV